MENDFPNQTTNQLLIQHISEAAVFTDPCFAITGGYLFIYKPLDAHHSSTGSYAQLRELSEHLLNIRETERTRIAREIHDELGQQLTILKMDLSWLNQKLKNCGDPCVLQKTGDALMVLNGTIKSVRRIATELRPSMLDDLGLIEAMEWQSKEFEKRSGIKIIFESGVSYLPVDNDVATSLFSALMIGGRFEINSKPGEGTTIIVTTSL